MPVLKNFISNIRLGKERKAEEGCHSSVDEKPMLRRANARFRKRNSSSVDVRGGLGIVHNSFPIRDVIPVSRQNSFEPGQSVKEFDISPVSKRDIPVIGRPGFMKQFFPKSGEPDSASEDVSIKCNPSSVQHVGETDGDGVRVMDRYSLEVHPVNLATAAARSALARRSLREFKSSFNARPILRVVNPDSKPELYEDEDEDAPVGGGELAKSKRRSKAKVPHIHNLDWSALSGGEALDIAKAYDAATSLNTDGGSPADSAIAISRSGSEKRYSGKGKGKSRQRRTISGAIDAWIESQAELENDGWREIGSSSDRMSLLSGHSSFQNVKLDSHSSREQELYLAALAEAIDFEMRQYKEQEKLLADAWEIESRRYLEQAQHRDEREKEAEAKAVIEDENRLRQEQEERERLLEEELIEQAIREIEEQERRAEEGRLAQQRARQKDCCVCGDTMDVDKFPVESPAKGCEHPPSTCKECLEAWMASEFETKGCDSIKCPECAETLEYQEVQQAASQSTFDAYDKLATRNALGSLDEFAWCLGISCGSGQLNIENNNFMDCVSCGYKQCLRHKVPWHDRETCEQYEYRTSGQKQRDEEKKEEAMLNKLSKKCPGANCGWRIEKIDGCEHMTCKKCKHQFCWICLADHMEIKRVGNTAHKSSCKFHSTNLDLAWPFNMH